MNNGEFQKIVGDVEKSLDSLSEVITELNNDLDKLLDYLIKLNKNDGTGSKENDITKQNN